MIADFNKKQKNEFSSKKIAFQVVSILFLVIIIILVFADFKMYLKRKELVVEISNYKKQIEGIKKDNQNLRDEIANSNNQDYIEKIAYEQLGEQKPGESEVIFISPPQKTEPLAKTKNPGAVWFSQVWQWIKSKF